MENLFSSIFCEMLHLLFVHIYILQRIFIYGLFDMEVLASNDEQDLEK